MKQDPIVGTYTEDELRKAAWIIGPHGAAAAALRDAEKRRKAGEDVAFYRTRSSRILVGPNVDAIMDLLAGINEERHPGDLAKMEKVLPNGSDAATKRT